MDDTPSSRVVRWVDFTRNVPDDAMIFAHKHHFNFEYGSTCTTPFTSGKLPLTLLVVDDGRWYLSFEAEMLAMRFLNELSTPPIHNRTPNLTPFQELLTTW